MKESVIYPGEYIPLQAAELPLERISPKHFSVTAPTNVIEKGDCYEVEIAVPGVTKEDITLRAQDHVLSVEVPPKRHAPGELYKVQMHDFAKENLSRNILFPSNAGMEFMMAELKDGILLITVPKTDRAEISVNRLIVVY